MRSWRHHCRTGVAAVLAGFLVGAVVGLAACDGGESASAPPTARSSERSTGRAASGEPAATRSPQSGRTTSPTPGQARTRESSQEPARATSPESQRTTEPAGAATGSPTKTAVVAPPPARTTTPAATTPAASASAAGATTGPSHVGPFGWVLLITLTAAAVIGGILVHRSHQRSVWDTEARALESETRGFTITRLAPVLSTTTTGRRGLAWPPVRAGLADLVVRWTALAARASGEDRRSWSLRVEALLEDLIAAVDAENEALAAGRDWMLLRTRVDRAEQALVAVLSGQPQPEPPAAGEPGPSAFPT
ncbi:hypothetical protein [Actinoplanes sp. NPDC049681]|uniref:hypothetical protein n=1 Tax=Actinoplanes sp. NPDC049681 TaxID=3363905 RepID=UPI0037AA8314